MSQTMKCRGVATKVMCTDGLISVVYHNTLVVEKKLDGSITLDTGGWRTATTKTRMNQASNQFNLGFIVFQKAGIWFVTWQGEIYQWPTTKNSITLKPHGSIS